jgi:hypothetical protein
LKAYLEDVLPQVTAVLDFKRCRIVSLVGENEQVVIAIDIGIAGTIHSVLISEHWEIRDAKARSLWVSYYDPVHLMELIKKNAAL